MKRTRRLSLRKNEREIGKIRTDSGLRICRWCKGPVQPPRRTFCSDACVHEWRLRSNSSYAREHIYLRDRGICARCALDTRYLVIQIEDVVWEAKSRLGDAFRQDDKLVQILKSHRMTWSESQKTVWHADHITPVQAGGGLCGLENFRTLCISCHKTVTAEFRKSKSRKI